MLAAGGDVRCLVLSRICPFYSFSFSLSLGGDSVYSKILSQKAVKIKLINRPVPGYWV